jgi:hypothetical protein
VENETDPLPKNSQAGGANPPPSKKGVEHKTSDCRCHPHESLMLSSLHTQAEARWSGINWFPIRYTESNKQPQLDDDGEFWDDEE